jgi:hypothetical protein
MNNSRDKFCEFYFNELYTGDGQNNGNTTDTVHLSLLI